SILMVLHPDDGLGGIAYSFDRFTGIEECDDAARAALEAFVAPREGPDQTALVEQELDIAAQVLGMQQAFLERPVVKREHVGGDFAPGFLVRVLERPE